MVLALGRSRGVVPSLFRRVWLVRPVSELAQKAGCVTLHLTWRQQQGLCGVRLAMPGWTQRLDLASHEQQLGVGQRTQPHPAFDTGELGSLVGIEAQVLFQKAESMFDSKPPQLHAAEIGQGQFA